MIEEISTIEMLKSKIAELQKRIKLNFAVLHEDELEPDEKARMTLEANILQKRIIALQNQLREEYLAQARNKKVDVRSTVEQK